MISSVMHRFFPNIDCFTFTENLMERKASIAPGLLVGPGPQRGPMLEHSVPEGTEPCGKHPRWSTSWGRTHTREVCGGLSSMRGSPHWSRGRVWGIIPLRRKEQQRTICDGLACPQMLRTPHPWMRSCGCPIPPSVQDQARWGSEQPGVVESIPAQAGGWNAMIFKVPSKPNYSVILQ